MAQALKGRHILIVEDESLVAMLLETILEDIGATPVGAISTVDEALDLLASGTTLDAALLDVNVAGHEVFPVADRLQAMGVPFVFSTGYGQSGLPDRWRSHPTIQKPFTEDIVRAALFDVLGVSQV